MIKHLFIAFILLFFGGVASAQLKASFTYDSNYYCHVPVVINFHNTSAGTFNSVSWDFGDGSTSTVLFNVSHTYLRTGTYKVKLLIKNGDAFDTATHNIIINSVQLSILHNFDTLGCAKAAVILKANAILSVKKDSISYSWRVFDNKNSRGARYYTQSVKDTVTTPSEVSSYLAIHTLSGCYYQISDTLAVTNPAPVLPSAGARTLIANKECTDDNGWTNYYFDNNTPDNYKDDSLVLSLKKNGNNIGTVGDGTFRIEIAATAGAGTNTGVLITNPLINNQSGFWVMNRYWNVTPTKQPLTPVGVRFYYNNQDFNDVNGSFPKHNLSNTSLIFYKTHGGNPDPTTNLTGASYITSISHSYNAADTTHWIDPLGYYGRTDKHIAEFQVANFSGGGGGATGDGFVLPLQITSFTATANHTKATLLWTSSQETNIDKYEVQVSSDGQQFSAIGTVYAAHNNAISNIYTFSYNEAVRSQAYYRLYIIDKDGNKHISNIVFLSFTQVAFIAINPNPASHVIYVKSKLFENKMVSIKIYNSAGVHVASQQLFFNVGANKLNISKLANGNYILAISDKNTIQYSNFVIIK